MTPPKPPRLRLCWHCNKKLRGNHHIERLVFGHMRVLHKSCSDELARVAGATHD